MEGLEEKIICAAVWYKELEVKKEIANALPVNCKTGVVFCGFRHSNCIFTKCAITGLRDAESGTNVQGFLTNKNKFVDRSEALEIAILADQILDYDQIRGNKLFSEDLY